jgi:hypothetical protein
MSTPPRSFMPLPEAEELARSPQLGCLSSLHHQLLLLRAVLESVHSGGSAGPKGSAGLVDQGRALLKVAQTLEHQLLAYRALMEDPVPGTASPSTTSGASRNRSVGRG